MKRGTTLAAVAALAIGLAAGASLGTAQTADDDSGADMDMMGPGMMMGPGTGMGPGMGMMRGRGMGPGMMRGMGMMGRGMGCGMMRGMGPRHCMRLMEMADSDNDGTVSAEEASSFWSGEFKAYDANGDGTLSLEEFATMHAAHTRPMMVDRFQFFDEDGDAGVTEDELQKPFERMRRFMGRAGDATMGPRGMRGRMGDGPAPQ